MKWKVDENKELPVAVIEDTEEGFGVCELEGGGAASRKELEKTAQLIAAAPNLLKACKAGLELVNFCYATQKEQNPHKQQIKKIEQTIAKAEKGV